MDIGPQYAPDHPFMAKARLHQSVYRATVLNVPYDTHGSVLSEVWAKNLLNYYPYLGIREALRKRYPNYSKLRDANMLRSEHIPFNLLVPLNTNLEVGSVIIQKAFGLDCAKILKLEIEYAPSPKGKYLNDNTSFDVYIEIENSAGKKCGLGIEVKYTEHAYPIKEREGKNVENHDSLYWQTARNSGCFINPDDPVFGTDALRQIWRNHLLGLAMQQHGDVDEFYSITLFPDGNDHFHKEIPRYRSHLKPEYQQYVICCTFESFIGKIGGSQEFDHWREWLKRRYVVG